ATCNSGGAGKWRADYSEYFKDANVIIVADRDDPGRAHARYVLESLRAVAASARVVAAKSGKDAADHLAAGHSLEELVEIELNVVQTQEVDAPEDKTDSGLARTFARHHVGEVLYVAGRGRWLAWDGRRFSPDEEAVRALAEESARRLLSEAADERDGD